MNPIDLLVKTLERVLETKSRNLAFGVLGASFGFIAAAFVMASYRRLKARFQKWRTGRSPIAQAGALLQGDSLLRVWRRFFSGLPYAARATVARFPSFLVFGPASSGKSQLIGARIDWQGQSSQFLPSFTDDPLLQIYLGRQTIAHELAVQVLYDTSPQAERALRRLWTPLFSRRPPVVLVVLSQPALALATPDDLTRQAQLLRGKLNLLGGIVKGPVEVRVVLTHMDELRGYAELSRMLNARGVGFDVDLPAALGREGGLQASLSELERFLPLALTTLPVSDFRAVLEFLRQAPRHLANLETFLRPLMEGSAAFAAPSLEKLYFAAPFRDQRGGNPFHTPRASAVVQKRPLLPPALYAGRWHLLGSSAALLLLALILGSAALSHHRLISAAEDEVARFDVAVRRAEGIASGAYDSAIVRAAEKETRQRVDAVRAAESRWVLYRWLFRERKAELVRHLLDEVRKGYLLPLLERYSELHDVERVVNVLAVLYACKDNQLGSLVVTGLRDLSGSIGLSEGVIDTYVTLCTAPWTGVASVPWNKLGTTSLRPNILSEQAWFDFFTVLERVFQAQKLTPAQLQTLQTGARPLMEVADLVGRNRHLMQVFRVLVEDSPLIDLPRRMGSVHPALNPPRWLRDQDQALSGVLHMIHDTHSAADGGGPMDLRQVLLLLTELGERDKAPDRVYNFELKDRAFTFSARYWLDLMMRSRHGNVLREAERRRAGLDESEDDESLSEAELRDEVDELSAPPGSSLRDLETGDRRRAGKVTRRKRHRARRGREELEGPGELERPPGELQPAGAPPAPKTLIKPTVDEALRGGAPPGATGGVAYTRVGFEQETKTVLQKLTTALGEKSKLPPAQRTLVSRYVEDEARAYALRYCRTALAMHRAYAFPTGDFDVIHDSLQEIVQPGGPLVQHLRRSVDNVNLPDLEGPFFRALSTCLTGFRPLVALMKPDKDGGYPALKPYMDILAGMLKELDTGKPPVERDDSKAVTLTDLLSPLGRIGLAALTEQETSILRQADHFFDVNGLRGPLSEPLVSPLQQLARLGAAEVERVLGQQWQTLLEPQVQALLSRYPFDRSAAAEVEPAALDALRPTTGSFWVAFRQTFGAVLVQRDGVWAPRSRGRLPAALPGTMLATVNQLTRISQRLYTQAGARQPILLRIRPLPVAAVTEGVAPSATYLSVGKVQIYGMNEAPVTRTIPLVWWQQDVAAVGAEFAPVGSGQRQTQSMEIADSQWSFYRLLDRGRLSANSVTTWRLPARPRALPVEVRFALENDPWEPFRFVRP